MNTNTTGIKKTNNSILKIHPHHHLLSRAIEYHYRVYCVGADRRSWYGHAGAVRTFMALLRLQSEDMRRLVFCTFTRCYYLIQYSAPYKKKKLSKLGRVPIIPFPSPQSDIVSTCIENNFSLYETTVLLNEYLSANNKPFVTRSAVHGCITGMMPLRTSVLKHKQGSSDPLSAWSLARKNWCHQLLIRFGDITWDTEREGDARLTLTLLNLVNCPCPK